MLYPNTLGCLAALSNLHKFEFITPNIYKKLYLTRHELNLIKYWQQIIANVCIQYIYLKSSDLKHVKIRYSYGHVFGNN